MDLGFGHMIILFWIGGAGIVVMGFLAMIFKCYHQVVQGTALVRNGMGGPSVSTSSMFVLPIIHRVELIDLSVKRLEIDRRGKDGLICQDNMRADLKVAFFVRVNPNPQDVLKVAQSIGCRRASDIEALVELFDAKFSEALKTVGKKFDFVDLYTERQKFKDEIIEVIGKDLNGYVLEDAAIDYLEQTSIDVLNSDNILDSEGIKKITDLTAKQAILSNEIQRKKEMTIVQQNVKAREAILEMERAQAEAEQKQYREIASITAREQAEAQKIEQEERLKSERARISTDEEIQVANENRERQVIVARKNKERTEAVETERVNKDRDLEITERERIVALARIEKQKAVETEERNIQETIKQRVQVQRVVVEEEERIKDTKEYAGAERLKKVAILEAEMLAEQDLTKEIKKAEAKRKAAEFEAQQLGIEWEANRLAAEKEAETKRMLALGHQAEAAAPGLAEAQVTEKKAEAMQKEGEARAAVLEKTALAEARGLEAKAAALEKQGQAQASVHRVKAEAEAFGIEKNAGAIIKQGQSEAEVLELKALAEAKAIHEKALAMKEFDTIGRDHEEFKLRLAQAKELELARYEAQVQVATQQAQVISKALEHADIQIIGGETTFFDKIVQAVSAGKAIDHTVDSSKSLTSLQNTFLAGTPSTFRSHLRQLLARFGMGSADVRNLTVSALLGKLLIQNPDDSTKASIKSMVESAALLGLGDKAALGIFEDETPAKPKQA